MDTIMVTVMDVDRAVHLATHQGIACAALAAIAAEPATIEDLACAMGRFVEPSYRDQLFRRAADGIASRSLEEGHLVIDLAGRLTAEEMDGGEFPDRGRIRRCDEQSADGVWLPYRLPPGWLWFTDWDLWRETSQRRRHERAAQPPLDTRAVLYGELIPWLVGQWQASAESATNDLIVDLHDRWLLTARDDLGGETPRDVLRARQHLVDGDIEDQAANWSRQGECPPGLPTGSEAYRYGGHGSHEIVLYHEMVAYLLQQCSDQWARHPNWGDRRLVRYLEEAQQEWLHQPQEALYHQSPAAVIACERARLPAVVPAGEESLDDDCPLCRMLQDSSAPMFWHLENYLLNDRFATSEFDTREEWQAWESDLQSFAADAATDSGSADPRDAPAADPAEEARIWRYCYTNQEALETMSPGEATAVLMFSIGGCLAELLDDLRQQDDSAAASELNTRFEMLREAARKGKLWALSLAVSQFCDALRRVAHQHQTLAAKCRDLESTLDRFAEQHAQLAPDNLGTSQNGTE